MNPAPMLADFAVRLAFGLTTILLLSSWRAVPLRFFQIQTRVILGVMVLAGLDQARSGGPALSLWLVGAGAALSYAATVAWGLGIPSVGFAAGLLAALDTAAWLTLVSRSPHLTWWALNASSRTASGFVMGATLTAMLLGHYYLTAPTMTIAALKRAVTLIAWGLGARCLLAGIAVWVLGGLPIGPAASRLAPDSPILLSARWGMGFAAAALAVYLTSKTVQIRSTQSATGLLYITTIFVFFGELTSMIYARQIGILC
jgi:hypothetical protein